MSSEEIHAANYLETITDLTDLIGTRLYDMEAPEGSNLPYVVMRRISNVRNRQIKQVAPRIELTAISDDREECRMVVKELVNALNGFCGIMDSELHVKAAVHVSEVLLRDEETGRYYAPVDFILICKEQ